MVDVGYNKPTNQIVVAGRPLVQFLRCEAAANMYPGRLAIQGTNDDDASVAGTFAINSMAIGWVGYEQMQKKDRPATVDTIHVIDAQIPLLNGGGFVIVGALAASQGTLKKGDALVMAANGTLAKATMQTITSSGAAAITNNQEVGAGTLPAGGPVVAYAEETIGAVAAITDIMVRSMI